MVHIGSCSCQDCPVMRVCACVRACACVCARVLSLCPPLSLKSSRSLCVRELVRTGVCAHASERVVLCVGTQVGEAAAQGKGTSIRPACDIPRPRYTKTTDLKLDDERPRLGACLQHILACGRCGRLPRGAVHGGRGVGRGARARMLLPGPGVEAFCYRRLPDKRHRRADVLRRGKGALGTFLHACLYCLKARGTKACLKAW